MKTPVALPEQSWNIVASQVGFHDLNLLVHQRFLVRGVLQVTVPLVDGLPLELHQREEIWRLRRMVAWPLYCSGVRMGTFVVLPEGAKTRQVHRGICIREHGSPTTADLTLAVRTPEISILADRAARHALLLAPTPINKEDWQ